MRSFNSTLIGCAAMIAATTAWSAGALAQQSGFNGQQPAPNSQQPPAYNQQFSNQNPSGSTYQQPGMSGQQGNQQSSQQGYQQPMNQQRGAQESAQQGQAPAGFVLIREDVVYLMANEPQNHFVQALADLSQKDNRKAAGEINVAAAYIDDISSRGNANNQQALSQCSQRLHQISQQVQSGQIQPKQLQHEFARCSIALSNHFQQSAEKDLSAQHQVKAGYEIRAAAMSLREGLAWENQQLSPQQEQAVAEARHTAAQLLQAAPQSEQAAVAASDERSQNANQAAYSNLPNQNPQQTIQQLGQQIQQAQQQLAMNSSNQNQQNQNQQNQNEQNQDQQNSGNSAGNQ